MSEQELKVRLKKGELYAEMRAYRSVLDNLCVSELSNNGRKWVIKQLTDKENEITDITNPSKDG